MSRRIGFIGLGIMGTAMARNLVRAGFQVTVYNRAPQRTEPITAMGALAAPTPRALAEGTDVILCMVTGAEAIMEILWGPDGAAQAFDGSKCFINMSTVSPRFATELGEKLASTSVRYIDAPVSGSKKPAEEATLIILAGGAEEEVKQQAPVFGAMGKKTVYCGPAGQGSMMKMAINLLLGIMMEGVSEMMRLGAAGGLSAETMLDVVLSGPLQCPFFQMKSDLLKSGVFPPQFPLKHMTKDLKAIVDTAHEVGVPAPVAHTLLPLYRSGVQKGWGESDFAAIFDVLKSLE
ncbi:MAG: NAD(P)-dependent oxidoreductase [Syntrophobacteraceae bacterium]